MPSSHLILCRPLLLLPPIPPSIRVFSNESTLHMRWPKYWSFSLSINPSNEHPGLISFRMDWLDLPTVQGTRKSLLQHHSSRASVLRCSAFLTVQLSHPYMTTGKTIALTRRTLSPLILQVEKSPQRGWVSSSRSHSYWLIYLGLAPKCIAQQNKCFFLVFWHEVQELLGWWGSINTCLKNLNTERCFSS